MGVTPAKAGAQSGKTSRAKRGIHYSDWLPVFAGMTN